MSTSSNTRPLNSHHVTWFHCLSHGVTVGTSFLMPFTNFEQIFPQTHSFLKAAHSNAAYEDISSMINKNKTNIVSYLDGK